MTKMVGEIEIDFCENGCQGIWFDEGEMKKIKEYPERDALYNSVEGNFVPKEKAVALKEEPRICPRCQVELYRYNWDMRSDIFLDACEKCNGLWLDAGELMGMNLYLKQILSDSTPDEDQIKLKLSEIEQQVSEKLEKDKQENIQKIVDWDAWIFDDIIRFLVGKFAD